MVNFIVIGSLFIMFWLFGSALAMIITVSQCSKNDAYISMKEGFLWASFPTIVYIILQLSPYVLSIFSEGTKTFFSWTGMAADDEGYKTLGIAYAMVLAGLMVTTRMMHTAEVAVCKPDVSELAAFQEDLMKKLKEKQAEKQHDIDVNKPDL
jgi:hypothetical protein